MERAPGGLLQRSQQDPALSGNGEMLAVIVDQRGRPTVQLRDLRDGKILPLRHFSRHQPHSSPSLSWNGRYLAVITQKGNRRQLTRREKNRHRQLHRKYPGRQHRRRTVASNRRSY